MRVLLFVFFLLIGFILTCGCSQQTDTQTLSEQAASSENVSMRMSVSNQVNGSDLSKRYSCAGPGQVPAIFWKDEPVNAQSMVLIMEDLDAPDGVYTHWIVYNLTPSEGAIPPNQLAVAERAGSGLQGINSMKTRGYVPPCPPGGSKHRYVFTLYALDSLITPDPADRVHVEAAMQGHIMASAGITTFFGQKKKF